MHVQTSTNSSTYELLFKLIEDQKYLEKQENKIFENLELKTVCAIDNQLIEIKEEAPWKKDWIISILNDLGMETILGLDMIKLEWIRTLSDKIETASLDPNFRPSDFQISTSFEKHPKEWIAGVKIINEFFESKIKKNNSYIEDIQAVINSRLLDDQNTILKIIPENEQFAIKYLRSNSDAFFTTQDNLELDFLLSILKINFNVFKEIFPFILNVARCNFDDDDIFQKELNQLFLEGAKINPRIFNLSDTWHLDFFEPLIKDTQYIFTQILPTLTAEERSQVFCWSHRKIKPIIRQLWDEKTHIERFENYKKTAFDIHFIYK